MTLVPLTPELLRATVRDRAEVGAILDVEIVEGWPNGDEQDLFAWLVGAVDRDPTLVEWGQVVLVHNADRALIGTAGFKGAPDESGTVEFGYGVVPTYQQQGYATEAVAALIAWAFEQEGVRRVFADCLPENTASARVLEKLGMRQLPATEEFLCWELQKHDWQAQPRTISERHRGNP